jgi:hypothetical protein
VRTNRSMYQLMQSLDEAGDRDRGEGWPASRPTGTFVAINAATCHIVHAPKCEPVGQHLAVTAWSRDRQESLDRRLRDRTPSWASAVRRTLKRPRARTALPRTRVTVPPADYPQPESSVGSQRGTRCARTRPGSPCAVGTSRQPARSLGLTSAIQRMIDECLAHASELRKHPQDARFGLVWPAPFG